MAISPVASPEIQPMLTTFAPIADRPEIAGSDVDDLARSLHPTPPATKCGKTQRPPKKIPCEGTFLGVVLGSKLLGVSVLS